MGAEGGLLAGPDCLHRHRHLGEARVGVPRRPLDEQDPRPRAGQAGDGFHGGGTDGVVIGVAAQLRVEGDHRGGSRLLQDCPDPGRQAGAVLELHRLVPDAQDPHVPDAHGGHGLAELGDAQGPEGLPVGQGRPADPSPHLSGGHADHGDRDPAVDGQRHGAGGAEGLVVGMGQHHHQMPVPRGRDGAGGVGAGGGGTRGRGSRQGARRGGRAARPLARPGARRPSRYPRTAGRGGVRPGRPGGRRRTGCRPGGSGDGGAGPLRFGRRGRGEGFPADLQDDGQAIFRIPPFQQQPARFFLPVGQPLRVDPAARHPQARPVGTAAAHGGRLQADPQVAGEGAEPPAGVGAVGRLQVQVDLIPHKSLESPLDTGRVDGFHSAPPATAN